VPGLRYGNVQHLDERTLVYAVHPVLFQQLSRDCRHDDERQRVCPVRGL
jgi:hypothetical protein